MTINSYKYFSTMNRKEQEAFIMPALIEVLKGYQILTSVERRQPQKLLVAEFEKAAFMFRNHEQLLRDQVFKMAVFRNTASYLEIFGKRADPQNADHAHRALLHCVSEDKEIFTLDDMTTNDPVRHKLMADRLAEFVYGKEGAFFSREFDAHYVSEKGDLRLEFRVAVTRDAYAKIGKQPIRLPQYDEFSLTGKNHISIDVITGDKQWQSPVDLPTDQLRDGEYRAVKFTLDVAHNDGVAAPCVGAVLDREGKSWLDLSFSFDLDLAREQADLHKHATSSSAPIKPRLIV